MCSLSLGFVSVDKQQSAEVRFRFDFMEMISLEGKTNFFEKRVGEYALADMTQSADTFSFAGDF